MDCSTTRGLGARCAALLVLATLAAGAPARAANAPAHPDSAAVATTVDAASVDRLLLMCLDRMDGAIPGSDTLVAWDTFRAHPQRTVELVLPTLRPIRRGLSLGAPNMVWRIRVLQRLTGMSFTARTRAKLGADEAAALAPDSARHVPFAGEKAKLGMTWVAPADAQKAIIAHWRLWWASDTKKPELPMVKHADDRTWWY